MHNFRIQLMTSPYQSNNSVANLNPCLPYTWIRLIGISNGFWPWLLWHVRSFHCAVTHVRNKNGNIKGRSPYVVKVIFHTKRKVLLCKGKNSFPLRAISVLSEKFHFKQGRNWRKSLLVPVVYLWCALLFQRSGYTIIWYLIGLKRFFDLMFVCFLYKFIKMELCSLNQRRWGRAHNAFGQRQCHLRQQFCFCSHYILWTSVWILAQLS